MTITRTVNGIEMQFQLTPQELIAAFFEQQHALDKEDIEWCIEDYTDEECLDFYGVTLEEFRSLISPMAYRLQKYLDNDDGWPDIRDDAVRDVIRDWKSEQQNG